MRLLTVKEACKYMKVSRPTLHKRIDEGFIYAKKDGGKWKIDQESIDTYFNSDREIIANMRF